MKHANELEYDNLNQCIYAEDITLLLDDTLSVDELIALTMEMVMGCGRHASSESTIQELMVTLKSLKLISALETRYLSLWSRFKRLRAIIRADTRYWC